MSEMLKTMLNRIEHNKNALKTKRYYVEDLISNEELIILVEEIERLNNIINELEKFVNNYIIWGGGKNEGKVFKWTGGGYVEVYDFITDLSKKIQELKGSDKND